MAKPVVKCTVPTVRRLNPSYMFVVTHMCDVTRGSISRWLVMDKCQHALRKFWSLFQKSGQEKHCNRK